MFTFLTRWKQINQITANDIYVQISKKSETITEIY